MNKSFSFIGLAALTVLAFDNVYAGIEPKITNQTSTKKNQHSKKTLDLDVESFVTALKSRKKGPRRKKQNLQVIVSNHAKKQRLEKTTLGDTYFTVWRTIKEKTEQSP